MTAEFSLAVHGLVYLYHHTGQTISSDALAQNICTNPARVRKVMGILKKSGLTVSTEGKGSGYESLPDAGEITLLQILDALEEQVVSASWRSGSVDMDCMIASGMADAMDEIYGGMNESCRDYLAKITIASIDRKLVQKKAQRK